MKAVVTRVNSASVSIDGSVCGRIGKGFLILLGVAPEDTPEKCRKLAEKILGLRVFRDENDKMNLSLSDVGGEVLVVSQFTLYGDVSHGRRPSFIGAGKPDIAIPPGRILKSSILRRDSARTLYSWRRALTVCACSSTTR